MAWVDERIFEYKGNDLIVMLYLVTHMNEKGVCAVGARTIAKDVNITYSAVREALKRLMNYGAIYEEEKEQTAQNTAHFTAHPPKEITIYNYESYTKQPKKQQRTLQRTLQRTKLSLEERLKQFGQELIPYVESQGGKYPAPMVRAFYNYWSEPNQTKTKMRFELQKTWNTAGRLANWANNNNIIIKHDDDFIDNNNNSNSNNNWQS